MKHKLIILTILIFISVSTIPASSIAGSEIYMAIEKGQVLFKLDRNHWEYAPNYLKLHENDRLRVMPGTVGKIFFSSGAEFHLPVKGIIQIMDNGIAQIMGDDKIITVYRDGLYKSEVVPALETDEMEYDFPRLIETYPSAEAMKKKKSDIDRAGDYLRSRLEGASRKVIDEDLDEIETRFTPEDSENLYKIRVIDEPSDHFEASLRNNITQLETQKYFQEKLRERKEIEILLKKAADLQKVIDQKKVNGEFATEEKKLLDRLILEIRSKRFRLRSLIEREKNIRKR